MKLRQVQVSDLSSITHSIFVSEHDRFKRPEFLLIRYEGEYRYGSKGTPDAIYIYSTARGAQAAWNAEAIILDFTALSYTWGDGIGGILYLGMDNVRNTEFPLVIVAGEHCREALQSFLRENYSKFCAETLDKAFEMAREKILRYREALAEHRNSMKKRGA